MNTRYDNVDFTAARGWRQDDVNYVDIDLATARTKPEELGLTGRYIMIAQEAYDDKFTFSTTKAVGKAIITLNEPNGKPIELTKGQFYDFKGLFSNAYIRNTAQSGKMLRIYTAVEAEFRPFSSEIEILGSVGSDAVNDEADNDIATSATLAFAADASAKSRLIINDSPYDLMFLGSNASGTNGAIIPALGGQLQVNTTSAIYLLSIGATAAKESVNCVTIQG